MSMCGHHYLITNLPFKMDFGAIRTLLRKKKVFPHKIIPSGTHARLYFKTTEEGDQFMSQIQEGFVLKKNKIHARKIEEKFEPSARKAARPEPQDEQSPEERLLNAVTPLHCMEYDEQLRLKSKQVGDFFHSTLQGDKMLTEEINQKLTAVTVLPTRPSPILEGYRNKCEFTIGRGVGGRLEIGFRLFKHQQGVAVASPECCPHVSRAMKNIVSEFRGYLEGYANDEAGALEVFDCGARSGHWSLLALREVGDGGVMATFVIYRQELTLTQLDHFKRDLREFAISTKFKIKSLYFAAINSNKSQYLPDVPCELLAGQEYVVESLSGLEFAISPHSFFQVNTAASEVLFDSVSELIRQHRKFGEDLVLLDLCCGTGTFAIILSKMLNPVKTVGIELCPQAVDNARANARHNNVGNVEFIAEDVRTGIARVLEGVELDALVVLDPPRNGVHKSVISAIRGQSHVRTIIFVSCSLLQARSNIVDLLRPKSNKLPGDPFEVKYVLPVDLFPHTPHLETIIYLTR